MAGETKFSTAGSEGGIVGCQANVRALKDALAIEHATIEDYKKKIRDIEHARPGSPKPPFSIPGLDNGIVGCEKNIQTIKDAIGRERLSIKAYQQQIKDIQLAEELSKTVVVEVERE